MEINIPEIKSVLPPIIEIEAPFNGESHTIKEWVEKHRRYIQRNKQLVANKSDKNDIEILISFLTDLLIRAMRGERGERIRYELQRSIRTKEDLTYDNYKNLLERAQYRWGTETGAKVITATVEIFEHKYDWEWSAYFDEAEKYAESNFAQDDLLKIKNVSFKVRDLALSSFSPNYVANDLHVVRVMTRIGLLNYGFSLLGDRDIEMGNNPANKKNYLFLHKLVLELSKSTGGEYSPADLDRILWNFGRSKCSATPECSRCPISTQCLTGKYRNQN